MLEGKLRIVCPSMSRPNDVKADAAVDLDYICVPESQRDAYAALGYRADILTHPDSVKGLSPKRQWICDQLGDVCMVDDDVQYFTRLYTARESALTASQAREMLFHIHACAEDVGAFLFSPSIKTNPTYRHPMDPFRVSGRITGGCFGLRAGSKLRFIPETVAVEDFYISGLNAYYHRFLWMDMRFGFKQCDTFTGTGGQAHYRTAETEKADTALLKRLFGDCVKTGKHKPNQTLHSKSAAPREIVFPF